MFSGQSKKIKLYWSSAILSIAILTFFFSCSSKTPYESLAGNSSDSDQNSPYNKIASFSFESANSGGALSSDVTASINSEDIEAILVDGTATDSLIPTLLFCSNADCSETDTADNLGLHYKPRYHSTDDAFYSCPAPIPGYDYDTAAGWFSEAVADDLCVKENRNTIFKEPVTYVVTTAEGSSREYSYQTTFVSATSSSLLSLSFLQEYNSGLSGDVEKSVSASFDPLADTLEISLPFGTDLTSLVPSFTITGSKMTIDDEAGTQVVSSQTAIDFSSTVAFFIHYASGSDGSGSDEGTVYDVDVSTDVPFNEFKLEASKNPGLSKDYTGVVDHNLKTISFTIDAADNATAVIPTIDLSDTSITISPTASSAQDFESSLSYEFTASSGNSTTYTIEVTKQSSVDLSNYSIELTKAGTVEATLDLSTIDPFGLGAGQFQGDSFIIVSRGYGANSFADWEADMTPDFSGAADKVYYFDTNSNFNGASNDYVRILKSGSEIDASPMVAFDNRLKLRQTGGSYVEITDITTDGNYRHLFDDPITSITGYTEPLFIWAIGEDDVTDLFTDYGSNFFLIYIP